LLDQSRISSGIVGVHWRILEQNDGCNLQILYLGSPGVRISLTGNIEGQKQIQEVTYPGRIITKEEQYSPPNLWHKILIHLALWLLQVIGAAALIQASGPFFPSEAPNPPHSGCVCNYTIFVCGIYME
jgi:hypothetical protein